MPVHIDTMDSQVEIMPSDTGSQPRAGGSSTAAPVAGNMRQLKEVLRPLVMELIAEELESYMRMRG